MIGLFSFWLGKIMFARLIKMCAVQCIAFLHGSSFSILLLFVSVSPSHKTTKLTVSKITQAGFSPKEMVTYSKETQTPTETPDDEGEFSIFSLYLLSLSSILYLTLCKCLKGVNNVIRSVSFSSSFVQRIYFHKVIIPSRIW